MVTRTLTAVVICHLIINAFLYVVESFGSDSNSGDSSEEEESSEDSDESDSSESESNSEGISSSEQEDEAVNEHMRNVSLPPTHPSQ